MLYFAYGSNLHHFQMKKRCKDSTFLKKMNLTNFRLTFRSKYRAADIEIGSYPFFQAGKLGVSIVIRSEDQSKIDSCGSEILKFVQEKKIEVVDR